MAFLKDKNPHRPTLSRLAPSKKDMGEGEEEEEQRRRPGEIRFGGMSFALPPPGDQDHDGGDDVAGENDDEEEEEKVQGKIFALPPSRWCPW